ncbi:amidohydrolase family protein [soil metagenome]
MSTASQHHTKIIDVHAHFTTPRYIQAAKDAGYREADGMPEAFWPQWALQSHVELMDKAGISKSYLSISSPGVHFGDHAAARALAREVNDAGADVVMANPDRFGLFASLPLPDIGASLAELARAYDELDADGVVVMSNSRGTYLGNPSLAPVLEELDRRSGTLFLHPTSAQGTELVDCGRPRPMIEFLFETARTVIDYVLSGSATRYPNIRLIVPHCGGVLPLLADRVALFAGALNSGALTEPVADTLRRFYYDLAGTPSDLQVAALRQLCPPDHLLYGSDYPWTPAELAIGLLATLDKVLDPDWRMETTHNAKDLFAASR